MKSIVINRCRLQRMQLDHVIKSFYVDIGRPTDHAEVLIRPGNSVYATVDLTVKGEFCV